MAATQDISLNKRKRCGVITLQRPQALNALTRDMIRVSEDKTRIWADDPDIYGVVIEAVDGKAFCAGGDIRSLYEWMTEQSDEALGYYREEYQHNWTLELFTKPTVSLVNGIVMGGGVGFCAYGTHRVAGESIKLAMPETAIGFFPDVGGSYLLSRFPGELGMYLGLTGRSIGQADAYHLGFATHAVHSRNFQKIKNAMIEADPIDPVVDALHEYPGPGTLMPMKDVIDRIFAAGTVEEIVKRLEEEDGDHLDWAKEVILELNRKSPLSLKITHKLIREARELRDLKSALIVDFRLAARFLRSHDFLEGIRAAIIDKDQKPEWKPDKLSDVSDDMIDRYFSPLDEQAGVAELELIDPWSIQVRARQVDL